MKIAIAQVNLTVGHIKHNQQIILSTIKQAQRKNIELLVFPELTVCGYLPEDLLYHQQFIDDCVASVKTIAESCHDICVVIGFPRNHPNEPEKKHNSAAFIQNGKLRLIYDKHQLPNYLVFDEHRYFTKGSHAGIIETEIKGNAYKFAINICEDIWNDAKIVQQQAKAKPDWLINISASPYASGKIGSRIRMLQKRCKDNNANLVYCNMVGGQDELVFDGTSVIINNEGEVLAQCQTFAEELLIFDSNSSSKQIAKRLGRQAEIYQALKLSTSDYFHKNGFKKAIICLSGGIDSALTAAIAVDALGAENITGLLLPSKFSSTHSIDDALQLAKNLAIKTHTIPIEPLHAGFEETLTPIMQDYFQNLTDENIQARIRGVLAMSFANNQNAILLSTGNKSEIAVGYSTLYGDMAGGFAIIKDLFKQQVYELCEYRNAISPVIPKNTIDKPPSAELHPEQKDSDSLPEYEQLDAILKAYIHDFQDAEQIASLGHDLTLVKKILKMVDCNEYKRQQAALGPRVTKMAFGKDRRMPITNGYPHNY
ncbi:MAG TPA: NAD+ synthase [Oceanospirillales bacterium]|nr:NAD+ synthase [Oceanospirillales bacterium]